MIRLELKQSAPDLNRIRNLATIVNNALFKLAILPYPEVKAIRELINSSKPQEAIIRLCNRLVSYANADNTKVKD